MLLITGPTGTVGTTLMQELSGRGDVRALVRDDRAAWAVERHGAQAARGSFEDEASLRAALDGVERLFLLSPPGADEMVRAQVRVVDLAAEAGVEHVVKLSSIGADEPTTARIIRAHRAIEERIEQSGMRWTHLRPHWFMDNELGQADAIAQGVLHAPDVGRISLVDSRDVAAVAARVLAEDWHHGRAYVLTGPQALSYAEIAGALGARWNEVTLEQARASMLDAGMPEVLAGGFTEIMARYQEGGATERVSGDVRSLLGRSPRSFAEFARDRFPAVRPPAAARRAVASAA